MIAKKRLAPAALSLLLLCACNSQQQSEQNIDALLSEGKWKEAEQLLETKLQDKELTRADSLEFDTELETIHRLRREFPYTRDEVRKKLQAYFPDLNDEQLNKWEQARQLEMRIIDGEKLYFSRSVSNFFRLNPAAGKLKKAKDGKRYDGVDDFQLSVIPEWFANEVNPGIPFSPKKIKVNYTLTVKANQVPDGEVVRCWLPYPRTGSDRLTKVEFLNANQKDYIIAPNEKMQRTIYMEKTATKDESLEFNVSYIFHSAAQWFDVKPEQAKAYDKNSDLYKKYTAERLPHIVFSERIKSLAQQIVGDATNPVTQVQRLYYWLNDNIPWAGALEYSVMPCIPEYVLDNMHGDCGMQTFLFLSMARSLGIPCKWQSGWYLLPQTKNLHDWAEVYYEGVGWVPVDPSFKLIDSEDESVRNFYLNGLDNYRLVVNDDFAQELYPPKEHYRSEPFDFQRGEVEWKGGNLYFDKWSYKMRVDYLD